MFTVVWMRLDMGEETEYGEVTFAHERAARAWINASADGSTLFRLWIGMPSTGELLVESRFPVLMVG